MRTARVPFKVAFRHTDASGRIHYMNIFRYFEDAEHALLDAAGYDHRNVDNHGFALPRVHVESDYKGALTVSDTGYVTCTVREIGKSSIRFEFSAVKQDGQEEVICATGAIVVVTMDPRTGHAIPVPNELRTALLAGES